jgi:hypothetical protein
VSICELTQIGEDPALDAGATSSKFEVDRSRIPSPAAVADDLQD